MMKFSKCDDILVLPEYPLPDISEKGMINMLYNDWIFIFKPCDVYFLTKTDFYKEEITLTGKIQKEATFRYNNLHHCKTCKILEK